MRKERKSFPFNSDATNAISTMVSIYKRAITTVSAGHSLSLFGIILGNTMIPGKYYDTKRTFETEYGKIEIKEGRYLIKEGKLDIFIETLFMDFCQDYKELICRHATVSTTRKNSINALQKIIEVKKIHFTKTLLKAFVKFILQPSIKKTVQLPSVNNI